VLIALDAEVVLRRADRVRRMALADFYVDYMKNRLEPGEFVQSIEVPPAPAGAAVRAYKLSKRYDCDISALAAGFTIALDGQGIVRHVRLAFGGMAAIVKRAAGAEAAIAGREWNEAALRAAQTALDTDFTPLTDMRGSADYRRRSARNLLERLWLETRRADALPATALSVWAAA
jgi:xanthine dehydrogenase small subunit